MLTLSTPYQEMHSIFWQEFDKCEYWVSKQINRHGKDFQRDTARMHLTGKTPEIPPVEYKGKTGNRWINNIYVSAATNNSMALGVDSACYWETYGSFGTFLPFNYDGTRCILIMPGHFWQQMCERRQEPMHGVQTAMKFMREHLVSRKEILPPEKGEHRRRIAIHWNDCSGYGVEVSPEYHIFEIRTCISEKTLEGHKLHERRRQTRGMMSEDAKQAIQNFDSLHRLMPDADLPAILNHMDADKAKPFCDHLQEKERDARERLIEELTKTMSYDEAIQEVARRNPSITYKDKSGAFVATEDVALSEFVLRMRRSVVYAERKKSCKDMLRTMRTYFGEPIPKATQDLFYNLYTTAFLGAWTCIYNWVFTLRTEPMAAAPLNTAKHEAFEQLSTDVAKWADEQDFNDDQKAAVKYYACFGFDRGIEAALTIAVPIFDFPIDIHPQSNLDYLSHHFPLS